jgi:hypothetical protein
MQAWRKKLLLLSDAPPRREREDQAAAIACNDGATFHPVSGNVYCLRPESCSTMESPLIWNSFGGKNIAPDYKQLWAHSL